MLRIPLLALAVILLAACHCPCQDEEKPAQTQPAPKVSLEPLPVAYAETTPATPPTTREMDLDQYIQAVAETDATMRALLEEVKSRQDELQALRNSDDNRKVIAAMELLALAKTRLDQYARSRLNAAAQPAVDAK